MYASLNKNVYIYPTKGLTSAAFLSCLAHQVVLRVMAYYEYRANTDVSRNFVSELEFPAITICNFNR